MAFATKYRIEFDTIKNKSVKIDIQEDAFAGSITEVKGASAELEWPDGDKSKIADVRRSNLKMFIYTSTPENFIVLNANKLKVLLYYNGTLNWSGWLDTGTMAFPLSDMEKIIELNAKDGLHLLEEAEFRNLSDEKPYLFRPVAEIIAYCLNKTELGLDFNTWINIYPVGYSVRDAAADPTGARDPLNHTYVSTRSFQNGSGDYDSPFVILQKICTSFKMTMFQARGAWHFVYVEDWIRNNGLYGTRFNSSAAPQAPSLAQRHRISVGLGLDNKFVNNDALISIQDNLKKVRINYPFDVPPQLIRNADLTEGDLIGILKLIYVKYVLTGWTTTGAPPFAVGILSVSSIETYEKQRNLQFIDDGISSASSATSTAAPCHKGDFFTASFKYTLIESYTPRLRFDVKIVENAFPFAVRYLGSDGKWKTTQQIITQPNNNGSGARYLYPLFNSYSLRNVDPIPFTGSLQYIFTLDSFPAAPANTLFHGVFDIGLDYEAYIGEAGQRKAVGQLYESFENVKTKSSYEDEIFVCDSLNIVNSGSMVDLNANLIVNWFHQGISESIKFGKIICEAVWKMFYRNFYRIEAAILNIDDGAYMISPLNTILPDQFNNKEFQVCSLRVDISNELAEGTFVELHDYTNTNDFDELATSERFRLINVTDIAKFVEPKVARTPPPWYFGAVGIAVWMIKNRKSKKS